MILISLFSIANAEVLINRNISASRTIQHVFDISLNITPSSDIGKYDIADMYPVGWTIANWTVSGNKTHVLFEQQVSTYKDNPVMLLHWNFSDNSQVFLKYKMNSTNASQGQAQLISVVVYPGGFTTNNYILAAEENRTTGIGINIQPIIAFKEKSPIIVAAIFLFIILLFIYYIFSTKKKPKQYVLPPKQEKIPLSSKAVRELPPSKAVKELPPSEPVEELPVLETEEVPLPRLPPLPKRLLGTKEKPKKKQKNFYKSAFKRLEKIEKELKKGK